MVDCRSLPLFCLLLLPLTVTNLELLCYIPPLLILIPKLLTKSKNNWWNTGVICSLKWLYFVVIDDPPQKSYLLLGSFVLQINLFITLCFLFAHLFLAVSLHCVIKEVHFISLFRRNFWCSPYLVVFGIPVLSDLLSLAL